MHPDELKQWILDHLNCDYIEVSGDGRHFDAVIVSDKFLGLNTLKRQQCVYACLGNKISSGEVHALTMKTLTNNEWQKK
ncbi:MAG: BolA family transcriptional regulator [Gammaproteobacteria bacterium]|nr:BolA family transcriptional regulator [Gammaproteobacteria bacterium]